MRGRLRITALAASLAGALVIGIPVAVSAHPSGDGRDHEHHHHAIKHVVLISVDGLHQSDLSWYVQNHPGSELAKLAGGGAQYTHASTPIPSDSFPGMVGQVTGGNPGTTGVYYDAEYNHNLLPAGTTSCTGQPTGAQADYFEVIVKNPLSIDSGQGLSGLPESILNLTVDARSLIDPSKLPVNPENCKPIYPHQYLK